jgi:hypothetical protein
MQITESKMEPFAKTATVMSRPLHGEHHCHWPIVVSGDSIVGRVPEQYRSVIGLQDLLLLLLVGIDGKRVLQWQMEPSACGVWSRRRSRANFNEWQKQRHLQMAANEKIRIT